MGANTYIILRLSALGDVAMTLPPLYAAADDHPSDQFVLVTQYFMSRLVIDPPLNLTTLPFQQDQDAKPLGLIKFARKLHRLYPDAVVVDLNNNFITRSIGLSLKTKGHKLVTIDIPKADRNKLLSTRKEGVVPPNLYLPRITDLYFLTLKRAGISMLSKGRLVVGRTSCPRKVTIGIAPYAQYEGKMILKEQLLELIDLLVERFPNCDLILYGAAGSEARKNRELVQLRANTVRLTSAQGLAEEVKEIAQLDCMVSMDSANQHIAAMVGTPVVSIWGATHPAAGYIPFRTPLVNCIGVDIECRPCSVLGNKPCHRGDYACLHQLSMPNIIAAIAKEVELRRK